MQGSCRADLQFAPRFPSAWGDCAPVAPTALHLPQRVTEALYLLRVYACVRVCLCVCVCVCVCVRVCVNATLRPPPPFNPSRPTPWPATTTHPTGFKTPATAARANQAPSEPSASFLSRTLVGGSVRVPPLPSAPLHPLTAELMLLRRPVCDPPMGLARAALLAARCVRGEGDGTQERTGMRMACGGLHTHPPSHTPILFPRAPTLPPPSFPAHPPACPPAVTNTSTQSWCPAGLGHWDGGYTQLRKSSKSFECFLSYAADSYYGLRLHRVQVTLPPKGESNLTTMHFSLVSRHRNARCDQPFVHVVFACTRCPLSCLQRCWSRALALGRLLPLPYTLPLSLPPPPPIPAALLTPRTRTTTCACQRWRTLTVRCPSAPSRAPPTAQTWTTSAHRPTAPRKTPTWLPPLASLTPRPPPTRCTSRSTA
jgi:hypothetical protein